MKIIMLRDREFPKYGLKLTGQVWNVSKKVALQFISQGFAEQVSTEVHTIKKQSKHAQRNRVE